MSDLLARLIAVAFVSGLFVPGLAAHAQESGYYYPLNQRLPLGEVARWNATIHPGLYGQTQPVRITLPSTGHVTYYDGRSPQGVLADAPSQAGLLVGNVYRVRISGMPEFPGIELYPSIELLDRLHPPPGQEQNFPVPVTFTVEEIETALQDRMVTKVVYLEQPQRAARSIRRMDRTSRMCLPRQICSKRRTSGDDRSRSCGSVAASPTPMPVPPSSARPFRSCFRLRFRSRRPSRNGPLRASARTASCEP